MEEKHITQITHISFFHAGCSALNIITNFYYSFFSLYFFYQERFAEYFLLSSFIALLYFHIIKVIHKKLPRAQHRSIVVGNSAAAPELLLCVVAETKKLLNYLGSIFTLCPVE